MLSVAEWGVVSLPAAAEVLLTVLCGRELDGMELGSSVRPVAEGLVLGQAAGTPAIRLSSLDLDRNRTLGNNLSLGHSCTSFQFCFIPCLDYRGSPREKSTQPAAGWMQSQAATWKDGNAPIGLPGANGASPASIAGGPAMK